MNDIAEAVEISKARRPGNAIFQKNRCFLKKHLTLYLL